MNRPPSPIECRAIAAELLGTEAGTNLPDGNGPGVRIALERMLRARGLQVPWTLAAGQSYQSPNEAMFEGVRRTARALQQRTLNHLVKELATR